MKSIIICIIISLFATMSNAHFQNVEPKVAKINPQFGKTVQQIKDIYGLPIEEKEIQGKHVLNYHANHITYSYFFDENGHCDRYILTASTSDINFWVKKFNDAYVSGENMEWKDYQTNSAIKIVYDAPQN